MKIILPAFLIAFLIGCANRQVSQPSKSSTASPPTKVSREGHQWLVPKGWVPVEPPGPLQFTAYIVPDLANDANVMVFKLDNYNYGILANVNRCHDQVGLPHIDEGSLKDISWPVKSASGERGTAFRIVGKEKSVLFAAFTQGETRWHFKMKAPNALAERQREAFDRFIGSFHF